MEAKSLAKIHKINNKVLTAKNHIDIKNRKLWNIKKNNWKRC
jgi:hypothetical protein